MKNSFAGIKEQVRFLEHEGVKLRNGRVNYAGYQWDGQSSTASFPEGNAPAQVDLAEIPQFARG